MIRKSPKRDQIEQFLLRELADGALPAIEIKRRAEAEGLKWTTTDSNARKLMVLRYQVGTEWKWSLPSTTPDIQSESVCKFRPIGDTFSEIERHIYASGLSEIPVIRTLLSISETEMDLREENARQKYLDLIRDFFDNLALCEGGQRECLQHLRDQLISFLEKKQPTLPFPGEAIRGSSDYEYAIRDHACRICFGRILTQVDAKRNQTQRCSECGTEVAGKVQALCCCGVKLKNGKDAGLRCRPNPEVSPEVPGQIIVVRVEELRDGQG